MTRAASGWIYFEEDNGVGRSVEFTLRFTEEDWLKIFSSDERYLHFEVDIPKVDF